MVVTKHRRTDPACSHFRGYPTNPLTRWWFDRGRGKACRRCMPARLWTCAAPCGWTNTSMDATCQRCGAGQVDGYGFRI